MALITAIAEKLRDDGVPLPSWMESYEVNPCPVPRTTPSIVVEDCKTETQKVEKGSLVEVLKTTHHHQIFGGVRLSCDKSRIQSVRGSPQIGALAERLEAKLEIAPSQRSISFQYDSRPYNAVVLLGRQTRAVGPCRPQPMSLLPYNGAGK